MHWIAWPCPQSVEPRPPAAHTAGVAGAEPSAPVPRLPSGGPGATCAAPAWQTVQGAEAWWALRFTPRVARVDEALLLEVSTTERLWGGRAALLAQLQAHAPAIQPGIAPEAVSTAGFASEVNASQAPPAPLAQGATSFQALALLRLQQAGLRPPRRVPHDLPLHTLTALRPHVASLARMGCNTWGQLRALPRDGVARRLGAPALHALDCAFGDAPHTHTWLELPETFALAAELPALATSADALLWSAHALLQALQAWLQARQQGVLALELAWHHDLRKVDGKPVPPWQTLPVRTAQPTQALAHLRRLLAEHLARTPLAAPANQIALRALQTVPMPQASASLLPPVGVVGRSAEDHARSESWHQLVERLSARLGPEQVQGVALVADHRPERMQHWRPASHALQAGGAGSAKAPPPHALPDASLWPTWLLRPPQRLAVQGSRPCYQGPLRLLAGPHRLEAAWWEAADTHESPRESPPNACGADPAPGLVVRDYFVAHNERAGHVWVFRERSPSAPPGTEGGAPTRQHRWFLHGIYG